MVSRAALLRAVGAFVLLSSCIVPDYHEATVQYGDHPWWKQTAVGDELSVSWTFGWYVGARAVYVEHGQGH